MFFLFVANWLVRMELNLIGYFLSFLITIILYYYYIFYILRNLNDFFCLIFLMFVLNL